MKRVYLPPAVGFEPGFVPSGQVFRPSAGGNFEVWLAELAPLAGADSVLVGFNLGGSLASLYASRYGARGLIATGSIARLSWFYRYSQHPVAVANREVDFPREHDLATTLPRVGCPRLVQFGRRDDWLCCCEEIPEACWVDDDHAMMGEEARRGRASFLESLC